METKKRILLVSNGFYPEISPRSFRATELAAEFARQGHEVTVYTKYRKFDYAEFILENKFKLHMWSKARFPAVPEYKGKTARLVARVLKRILLVLFEYPAIEEMFKVKKVLKHENGYDLLISFAVPFPVHWGVAWARTKDHPIAKVWVADCGDPYMGCKTDSFKKLFYFKLIEKWWNRKADYISIPVENARSAYYSEYDSKIKVIPQGFKFTPIAGSGKQVKNAVPTFAYTGMFIPGIRDPGELLDHLATLKRPFKFIIYTNDKNVLKPYLDPLKGKLIIHNYIPRDDLIIKLTQMDFLVNFDNNTGVQTPSKLIDYGIAGRPVLNITTRLEKVILNEFLDKNYSHAYKIGDLTQYDINNVAMQFISLSRKPMDCMASRKKILLVSNGFYPEISPRSFRATELASEFARQGHEVTVYTKYRKFDYAEFLIENKFKLNMWGKARFPAVPEFKGKTGRLITRAVRRLILMLFEYPAIEEMFKVKKILKNENGYDLLISFAVPFPVHWGTAWARTKNHEIARVWVADCGDPYMGNTNDSFRKFFYFKYPEKCFCKKADFITIPKIEMKENYYREFYSKIREIPQGFNFDKGVSKDIYEKNPVPTFAFAGSFIKEVRDPSGLMEYLSDLKLDFKFIIYTKNKEFLTRYSDVLGAKLIVHDYIPREDLIHELSKMDFLINIAFDLATQAPSKLIDYAIAGRPILSIGSNHLDPVIFSEFINGIYNNQFKLNELEKYDIKNVSKQFLDLHLLN